MRQFLTFRCEHAQLYATLDRADGPIGLLIVSGGNETRFGAARSMARLALDLSDSGMSVFRFDRRGVGDSEGLNRGFEGAAADIRAAVQAFRLACPHIRQLIAYGNCDAAAALLLTLPVGVDEFILSNVWCRDEIDSAPPAIAVRAHLFEQLKDPRAWKRALTGGFSLRKLGSELVRLAVGTPLSGLSRRLANQLLANDRPTHILLARGDLTGMAFLELWQSRHLAAVRHRPHYGLTVLNTNTHGFTLGADYEALRKLLRK